MSPPVVSKDDPPTGNTPRTTTSTTNGASATIASSSTSTPVATLGTSSLIPIAPSGAPFVASSHFAQRLNNHLKGQYTKNMRRPIQTCVLVEADRCLQGSYGRMKVFQKKAALLSCAIDIVKTLTFLPEFGRDEIMYRTASGKQQLSVDLAWRRMKQIDREIRRAIVPKIKELMAPSQSHGEVCQNYLQSEYEMVSNQPGKPAPSNWEFTHDNNFLAYRMFYTGDDYDKTIPPAIDPNPGRVLPTQRPDDDDDLEEFVKKRRRDSEDLNDATSQMVFEGHKHRSNTRMLPAPKRRALLKEVKEHLEILREFEGADIVSEAELRKKKMQLFYSLPDLPFKEEHL